MSRNVIEIVGRARSGTTKTLVSLAAVGTLRGKRSVVLSSEHGYNYLNELVPFNCNDYLPDDIQSVDTIFWLVGCNLPYDLFLDAFINTQHQIYKNIPEYYMNLLIDNADSVYLTKRIF